MIVTDMPLPDKTRRQQRSLYDFTPSELGSFFLSIGDKPYRAKQLLEALYSQPIGSIDEATTLPKFLRERLSEIAVLAPITLRTTVTSKDGTIKHAYEVPGSDILLESVWMPSEPTDLESAGVTRPRESKVPGDQKHKRHTLCISSQLGCAVGCRFCATGHLGLHGQLTTGQIVYQVIHARILYGAWPDTILFMGMGEAMHNFDAVSSATEILTHPDAVGMSPRRIVVSTAGELERLGAFHRKFPRTHLAISLNAPSDSLRTHLMPLNDRFNLRDIRAFIESIELSHGDRITLEYVLLGGINDTPEQVNKLLRYLRPLAGRVKVNLIPFNRASGLDYKPSYRERAHEIQEAIKSLGIRVFIRRNRGRDTSAACGQLAGGQ